MKNKKIIIYSLTLLIFIILFSFYVWLGQKSVVDSNRERMESGIAISRVRIQKNLEYCAKDLMFQAKDLLAGEAMTQKDAVEAVSLQKGNDCYIIDKEGVIRKENGLLDGRRVETSYLESAFSSGYVYCRLTNLHEDTQDIILIMPVDGNELYYFAKRFTAEEFLDLLSGGQSHKETSLFLFDKWGNCLAQTQWNSSQVREEAAEYVAASVQAGADTYAYNPRGNEVQQVGVGSDYNIYIRLDQPESWVLGARVAYGGETQFLGVSVTSMIVFFLMILFLCVVIGLDVLNDRDKQKQLLYVENTDHLTGLVNGTGLQEAVDSFIQSKPICSYSFVYMDIVAFNRINSLFGYSLGDVLLRTLGDAVREHYSCGSRINADNFTFFVRNSQLMVEEMEETFFSAIEKNVGKEYIQMVMFKFGIYPIQDEKATYREMYDGALLALKDAKRQCRQNQVVYDEKLRSSMEMQKNIEMNMMHALSREEFLVYIQPQFEMPGEVCSRGETLIRWHSEYMGFLPPDKFIAIFESNGFIVETDFFMLESAMQLLQDRLSAGKKPFTFAVNQSKVTISFPNYYERLKALVDQYQVPLQYIELEVTESTLENDWESIVPLIHNMKKLGFSIAMDDFGSGFSSLNVLRILPIDILKIDKEFLRESDVSDRTRTIIRNIINMAKQLNVRIVCEGVETAEQLEFLREAGCDIIQGYYYSRPIPLVEFGEKYMS